MPVRQERSTLNPQMGDNSCKNKESELNSQVHVLMRNKNPGWQTFRPVCLWVMGRKKPWCVSLSIMPFLRQKRKGWLRVTYSVVATPVFPGYFSLSLYHWLYSFSNLQGCSWVHTAMHCVRALLWEDMQDYSWKKTKTKQNNCAHSATLHWLLTNICYFMCLCQEAVDDIML